MMNKSGSVQLTGDFLVRVLGSDGSTPDSAAFHDEQKRFTPIPLPTRGSRAPHVAHARRCSRWCFDTSAHINNAAPFPAASMRRVRTHKLPDSRNRIARALQLRPLVRPAAPVGVGTRHANMRRRRLRRTCVRRTYVRITWCVRARSSVVRRRVR